ncbi:MAG: uroporphyrinogen decarboxylase [Ardenticatenales bacterium]
MTATNDRFLRACRREAVDATPIWLMRQAGRYMPEYRALRERYGILDIIRAPELALEVTLQPIRAFDVDAAIIFADILTLLPGMGLELSFARGEGPIIHNPPRTAEDIARLGDAPIEESVGFTLEAIRLARRELDGRVPLIGFSGAPFTLACYALEGGSSRHYAIAKGLMFREPAAWDDLMGRLAERVGRYLLAQAAAGAQALQLFDSWVGALAPADYRAHVLPYTKRAIEIARPAGVPILHFGTGTAGLLADIASSGADVVSVDTGVDLDRAWAVIGDRAIQGNLDPIALLGGWDVVRPRADDVLARAAGRPGHIFNLGHGVLPQTEPDVVRRLVDHVHAASKSLTSRPPLPRLGEGQVV